MSDVIIPYRFKILGNTAAALAADTGIPKERELVIETDTGRAKLGDGTTGYPAGKYVNLGAVDFSGLTNGDVPTWDSATSTFKMAAGGGGGGIDRSTTVYESWDFIKEGVTTNTGTVTSFVTSVSVPVVYISGSGATASLTTDTGAPGIARLTTGTTSSGYARMFFAPPAILLGGGQISYKARMRIPTLSTSGQRFAVIFGLADSISGAPKRIGAQVVDNTNSGQWTVDAFDGIGTGSASANTSVAPAANTWFTAEWVVNAAASSAELFINGASAGTIASHIPTGVPLGLIAFISKSVGSTPALLDVDISEFTQTLTTAR